MAKGRRLQLLGYDVYRFGGSELHASRGRRAVELLDDFFTRVLD
jgi:hypothetical protein